jgi:hypothetical protein
MLDGSRTHNHISGSVIGNVVQAATVEMITSPSRPIALTGLPLAIPAFVGRDEELVRLAGILKPREPDEFSGGVLMIDMLGYDSPEHRVRPEVALGSVLCNVGIMGEHVPPDGPGRERLWRTLLAERAAAGARMLIIIDNVSSSDQVRPLLPGVPLHEVVVTSRHALADVEAASLFRLGVLNSREAAVLLRQQLTAADVDDVRAVTQSAEAEQIARLCGGLPLAIRIAGALLAVITGNLWRR